MQVKAQLAHNLIDSRNLESHLPVNMGGIPWFPNFPSNHGNFISPQSSLESIYEGFDVVGMREDIQSRDEISFQPCTKKRHPHNDLGELQALALRMIRD